MALASALPSSCVLSSYHFRRTGTSRTGFPRAKATEDPVRSLYPVRNCGKRPKAWKSTRQKLVHAVVSVTAASPPPFILFFTCCHTLLLLSLGRFFETNIETSFVRTPRNLPAPRPRHLLFAFWLLLALRQPESLAVCWCLILAATIRQRQQTRPSIPCDSLFRSPKFFRTE